MDPSNPNITWLTQTELEEIRLRAEIDRQVAQGSRCTDPRGLDALMDKYLDDNYAAGPTRRGTVRHG